MAINILIDLLETATEKVEVINGYINSIVAGEKKVHNTKNNLLSNKNLRGYLTSLGFNISNVSSSGYIIALQDKYLVEFANGSITNSNFDRVTFFYKEQ